MIWRVVAICILTLSVTIEVEAQSRAELALKVERLEREMIALENRLRGGAATSSATGASAGAQGSLDDRTLLADLAAKIGTVERQMRAMTGRMEELEHKQRQLDEALDLLRRELQLQQQEAADYRASQAAQPNSQPVTAPADTAPAAKVDEAPKEPEISLPEGEPSDQYQYAFGFIQKNDLDSGFKAMDMFLKAHPDDSLAGNAKFWLGRIHLLKGRLPQAAQQLLALIEEHPNHGKRADALLDLADVLIGLGSKPDACNALAEFRRSADNASDRLKARAERTAAEAGCAT
ncbi:tetratricopeptide repeat protein [Kordiimonas lacus]|uniref:TolA-binding protein n=1 Tax=Kordiimonas lacus TaxID=637679 RepID=A0A1G7DGM4_9PROT|nr:tetratricopeptide repeat protein [Kordiimonas lacus]SDE50662.1 TolA-binding protein [Kordiimonas lacus]